MSYSYHDMMMIELTAANVKLIIQDENYKRCVNGCDDDDLLTIDDFLSQYGDCDTYDGEDVLCFLGY